MVSTKIYDKWDDFNFEIVNFPFLEGDVPRSPSYGVLVREPVIGLTKWLRPKGLKVCSYVGKCAEFKNQTLKKSTGTQKCYAQRNTTGYAISQIALTWGYLCRFII